MKVLLLANQPERTTRLKMFQGTLEELGYEVVIPKFETRNWIKISGLATKLIKSEKPDVIHIFNVPDVIYRDLPKLRGSYFKKMIYDYRSPWGVEMQMSIGPIGMLVGEHFEKKLALRADAITTVNTPLGEKVKSYVKATEKDIYVVPNYPSRSFVEMGRDYALKNEAIIFVGRISKQEGVKNLLRVAEAFPHEKIWVVGDGPFAWWYLRNKRDNVKFLGWQPHQEVARLVKKAKLCLITMNETILTPYATDKSVWKLNEYLNLEKLVIASGITKEEDRKNLVVVKSSQLEAAIKVHIHQKPEALKESDYRFWDVNRDTIREVYEGLW